MRSYVTELAVLFQRVCLQTKCCILQITHHNSHITLTLHTSHFTPHTTVTSLAVVFARRYPPAGFRVSSVLNAKHETNRWTRLQLHELLCSLAMHRGLLRDVSSHMAAAALYWSTKLGRPVRLFPSKWKQTLLWRWRLPVSRRLFGLIARHFPLPLSLSGGIRVSPQLHLRQASHAEPGACMRFAARVAPKSPFGNSISCPFLSQTRSPLLHPSARLHRAGVVRSQARHRPHQSTP